MELLAETILKKNLSFIAPEIVLASGQELLGIPEDDDEREEMVKKVGSIVNQFNSILGNIVSLMSACISQLCPSGCACLDSGEWHAAPLR